MYFNNQTIVFLNGKFEKATNATTSLYDQTVHYGYGVFEGIRAYSTEGGVKIFKAKEHYERLKHSCEAINIPFNYGVDDLIDKTYELLAINNFKDAYIRPIVYCSPNMSLTKPNEVFIMICSWEWGAYLGEKLLDLCVSSFCRPHPRSIKVDAKVCGHYVNSILATSEAKATGYDEAILLDSEGFLAEGPGSNLFFEKNGILYTPQTGNILPGITRATVIDLCEKMGIKMELGLYTQDYLENADSAFLCGTAAEIVGINSLHKKAFPQKWEDSLGKKLQIAYKNLVLEKS